MVNNINFIDTGTNIFFYIRSRLSIKTNLTDPVCIGYIIQQGVAGGPNTGRKVYLIN